MDACWNIGPDTRAAEPPWRAARDPCAPLRLGELALLVGIPAPSDPGLVAVSFPSRRIRVSEALFREGDPFEALYAVGAGTLKTVAIGTDGGPHVLGFRLAGDVIGVDALGDTRHHSESRVLEAGKVWVLGAARLAELASGHPSVEAILRRAFGLELARTHKMMALLGRLRADGRVAAFLLDLSRRYADRGQSATVLPLAMTRADIGSYLGVQLETVSRSLSGFAAAGLLAVHRRAITLLDLPGLRRVVAERTTGSGKSDGSGGSRGAPSGSNPDCGGRSPHFTPPLASDCSPS